jgi:secreted PhoX family phosphatase
MTGPTFIGDTLVISVQHPGENVTFGTDATTLLTRTTQILNLDGSGTFDQKRNVGKGSQWPGNVGATPAYIPKPTVIGIRRRGGRPDWDDGRGDWDDDKDHKDREDDKGGKTER